MLARLADAAWQIVRNGAAYLESRDPIFAAASCIPPALHAPTTDFLDLL